MRGAWLLLMGVAVWRVWGWWGWRESIGAGDEISLKLRVGQVDQKWSNALMKWRGLRVECPFVIDGCDRLNEVSRLAVLRGIGRTEDWVIGEEVVGKKLVVSKILSLYESKSLIWRALVRVFSEVDRVRNRIVEVYRSNLSEPGASLLSGIVLGSREKMPRAFYDALVKTGTLHVIAASGYNITVVAQTILWISSQILRRKQALIVSFLGILGYVLLAGGSPAVVRAGLMGSLVFGAMALGRMYVASYGLWLSGWLMVVVWPWMLRDVSFQLSMAATAGILYGYEPMRRLVLSLGRKIQGGEDKGRQIRETEDETNYNSQKLVSGGLWKLVEVDLATTLAATLATLPITLITFDRVSLVSPGVNMLILWLVPPLMALGAAAGILGMLAPYLGTVVAWLTWPLLQVFVKVIEVFALIPFASVELGGINWWLGAGWWLFLAGWWRRG